MSKVLVLQLVTTDKHIFGVRVQQSWSQKYSILVQQE